MARKSAVSVDDDFAPGEAAVAHRSADDESPRGIDVVLGALVDPLGRQHGLQDLLHDRLAQCLVLMSSECCVDSTTASRPTGLSFS